MGRIVHFVNNFPKMGFNVTMILVSYMFLIVTFFIRKVVLNDNSLDNLIIFRKKNNLYIHMTMLQSYRKKVTKVQCIKPASSELNSLYFYIFLKFTL